MVRALAGTYQGPRHPLWCGAWLRPDGTPEEVSVLLARSTGALDEAGGICGGHTALVISEADHRRDAPRWLVCLPLAEPWRERIPSMPPVGWLESRLAIVAPGTPVPLPGSATGERDYRLLDGPLYEPPISDGWECEPAGANITPPGDAPPDWPSLLAVGTRGLDSVEVAAVYAMLRLPDTPTLEQRRHVAQLLRSAGWQRLLVRHGEDRRYEWHRRA